MISNKNNDSADVNHHQMTPKILPLVNGPYYLINDMKPTVVENLQNSNGEPLSTVRGVALCRCGASKNKPFCDGSHKGHFEHAAVAFALPPKELI